MLRPAFHDLIGRWRVSCGFYHILGRLDSEGSGITKSLELPLEPTEASLDVQLDQASGYLVAQFEMEEFVLPIREWHFPQQIRFSQVSDKAQTCEATLVYSGSTPLIFQEIIQSRMSVFYQSGSELLHRLLDSNERDEAEAFHDGIPSSTLRILSNPTGSWWVVMIMANWEDEGLENKLPGLMKIYLRLKPFAEQTYREGTKQPATDGTRTEPDLLVARGSLHQLSDLEDRVGELRVELEETRDQLGNLESELGEHQTDVYAHEVNELHLLGRGERDHIEFENSEKLTHTQNEIQDHYLEIARLYDECGDATDEITDLETELDDLESEIDAYSDDWQRQALERGQSILDERPVQPPITELDESALLEEPWLNRLSDDVKKLLQTNARLFAVYEADETLREVDNSPVVGTMSKCCERLFSDAFSQRLPGLLENEAVIALVEKFGKAEVPIPDEDAAFRIDKGALGRVVNMLHKEKNWSGTRNAGIAMLLFGRSYSFLLESDTCMNNPLGLPDTESGATATRVACYELQDKRNGFIHHDLASWDDALRVRECFLRCLRGFMALFYAG